MHPGVVYARKRLGEIAFGEVVGHVTAVSGLSVSVSGLGSHVAIGDRIELRGRNLSRTMAEVVGFAAGGKDISASAQAMVFESLAGIGPGMQARFDLWSDGNPDKPGLCPRATGLAVDDTWLGRVIDPLGRPIDGKGALAVGAKICPARASPPEAIARARLGPRLDLGVRAMNLFTTCRVGQRLGLFAGSGVGKSTLLSMLARQTECDVAVIALVGERGREVREFLEDDLGPAGVARSVTVIATSDSSPLMRREAAYSAMTVAEYFRDQGKSVLLLMDSVTRFCLALREIALSAGEAPATRGYPPSVFAELPRLLERAGPGPERTGNSGHITALFTVLVEGDDHNEPIADAVRGILDGHVVMDRRLGEAGRYPAIDVLRSLSRTASGCNDATENALIAQARKVMSTHGEMADMIRLGAYKTGTDPMVDEAIAAMPRLEAVLRQDRDEATSIGDSFRLLGAAIQTDVAEGGQPRAAT